MASQFCRKCNNVTDKISYCSHCFKNMKWILRIKYFFIGSLSAYVIGFIWSIILAVYFDM